MAINEKYMLSYDLLSEGTKEELNKLSILIKRDLVRLNKLQEEFSAEYESELSLSFSGYGEEACNVYYLNSNFIKKVNNLDNLLKKIKK